MATGCETNYSCCSSCLDDGRNTVARHYCVDCEMYFCTKCVKCHNKIPSLKAHQVNEVTPDSTVMDDDTTSLQSNVPSEAVQSLRCTLHQGKPIDTHCKDHDEVCCGACAVVKHRSCTTVSTYVASEDFKASSEANKCKEALNKTTAKFIKEKEKRVENLDKIGKQKQELIENVDTHEEKIIANIKELVNISRNEIRSKYEEHKIALGKDIEALDVGIATNTEYAESLEQGDEEQQFIYTKMNKTVIKDEEMLLQATTMHYRELEIRFIFDEILDNHILQMKSFGKLDGNMTTFHKNVDITQDDDHFGNSFVYDACLMDSGELLVTDDDNKKLKRFDSDMKYKDAIVLSGQPVAVCKINDNEVAVRIQDTKVVQFVSVGQSMQLTSSFELAENGHGMIFDDLSEEILACETDKVSVYSKAGDIVRTYDKDRNGEKLFSDCRQIALCLNKQEIYVTDVDKGLVILDKSGILKMIVTLQGVSVPGPLCLLHDGICLAGCEDSCVMVQVDKDGKQVGKRFDSNDKRTHTYCAIYDRKYSRLIVGGSQGVISVYTLSAK